MSLQKSYKFLDLSGYMFTGKAAAIDLVREFAGYNVPYYRTEFPLIRVQDGIMDLEKALVDDWSPIRSDVAISRFLTLVKKLAQCETKWSLHEEELVGFGLDREFHGKFYEFAVAYVESLVSYSSEIPWPYASLNQSAVELLGRRLGTHLLGRAGRLARGVIRLPQRMPRLLTPQKLRKASEIGQAFYDELADQSRRVAATTGADNGWPVITSRLAGGENFHDATQQFLERLLALQVSDANVHTIVMHNGFEPYNPARCLRYFRDARCIVVDRDPRDIYVTAVTPSKGFNDAAEVYRKIAGAVDSKTFVQRFLTLRRNTRVTSDPPGRVLRLRFEDLVLDYECTLQKVYHFLGESAATHVQKGAFFKPDESSRNIGLWKTYAKPEEIRPIEAALSDYCYAH